jgi:hypothetical protein
MTRVFGLGAVRGAPHPLAVQAVGVAVFGTLAVTGLPVDPEAGRWLVGVELLLLQ